MMNLLLFHKEEPALFIDESRLYGSNFPILPNLKALKSTGSR